MRICLISEYFYPDNGGGTGTVLSHLARHLKDAHADLEIPPSYDPTWKDPVTSYTNAFAAWRRKLPQGEPPAGDRQLLETIKLELVNARDAGQDAAD